VFALEEVNLG